MLHTAPENYNTDETDAQITITGISAPMAKLQALDRAVLEREEAKEVMKARDSLFLSGMVYLGWCTHAGVSLGGRIHVDDMYVYAACSHPPPHHSPFSSGLRHPAGEPAGVRGAAHRGVGPRRGGHRTGGGSK